MADTKYMDAKERQQIECDIKKKQRERRNLKLSLHDETHGQRRTHLVRRFLEEIRRVEEEISDLEGKLK